MYITKPEPYFAPWLLVNSPSAKSLSNLKAADLRVLEPLTGGGGGGPDEAAPAVFRNDDVTLDLTAANVAVAAAAAGLAAAAAGLAVAAAAAAAGSLGRTGGMGRVLLLTDDVRGFVFGLVPVTLVREPDKIILLHF